MPTTTFGGRCVRSPGRSGGIRLGAFPAFAARAPQRDNGYNDGGEAEEGAGLPGQVVADGQGLCCLAASGAAGGERREQGEAERSADLLRRVEHARHEAGVGVGGAGHAQGGDGRQGQAAAETEEH